MFNGQFLFERPAARQELRLLISFALSVIVLVVAPRWVTAQDTVPPQVPIPQTKFAAARALEDAMVEVIANAEKSVVAIARGKRGEVQQLKDPQFVPYEYSTGVVVDKSGLILTNYHSLGDANKNDYVVWIGGKSYSQVVVKAADPWTDLAVLEIAARNLTPIQLGDGSNLRKGRIVIALGNPHAIARDGDVSATWGIVSNLSRKIDGPLQGNKGPDTVPPYDRETRYHFGGLIQTDAKLARGTSGGPLLNLDGKMIGLSTNVAMMAGFEKGTGYAIPVDDHFLRSLDKLKRGEAVEQGFLGVGPRNPNPRLGETGVILENVVQGTPAGQAGLISRDEVIRIDGQPTKTIDDLFFQVGSLPPNHVARIDVLRGNRPLTIPVRLTKKPVITSRPQIATAETPAWRGLQVDFATALSTNRLAGIDPDGCVVVKQVDRDSVAWKAGLRVGTMISQLNAKRVDSPRKFYKVAEKLKGDVRVTVFDRFRPRFVRLADGE